MKIKFIYFAVVSVSFVASSCKDSDETTPQKATVSGNDSSHADTDESLTKKASELRARIAAGLASYYRVGESELEIQPIDDENQRAILKIPVLVGEDLYEQRREGGKYILIAKVKEKGDADTVVLLLTGTKSATGWTWSEKVEKNVNMDTAYLPRGRFPSDAMLVDSPEHHARLKEDARLNEEAETAKIEAAGRLRQEKTAAITAKLRSGAQAFGIINGYNYKFTVLEADETVPYWKLSAVRTSPDRTKSFSGAAPLTISYDETRGECLVSDVQYGYLGMLKGASVVPTATGLTFTGERVEVVPPGFDFK